MGFMNNWHTLGNFIEMCQQSLANIVILTTVPNNGTNIVFNLSVKELLFGKYYNRYAM